MSKYHRILVAVDGLDMTDSVIKTALEFTGLDIEMYLVKVVDFPGTMGAINEDAIISQEVDGAKYLLKDLIDRYPQLEECSKAVHPRVVIGNPHHVIAQEFVNDNDIDLIIIGKTSHTSLLDKIFVGSTAKAILEDAVCDVIVVKKPVYDDEN